ncbi:probable E3 ubiquitin-protein ligase DTX3 [Acipenser ruthenus]|uniref:probable E3 ubiquitin-protein ligase DTX3 n=1 Tax=Acipenser ruthenus TaxID=7906 RepID=UPI00274287A1|nr:probable E3 ubiquitin-protein ligase DTX3 [Acipenser ruthenus]
MLPNDKSGVFRSQVRETETTSTRTMNYRNLTSTGASGGKSSAPLNAFVNGQGRGSGAESAGVFGPNPCDQEDYCCICMDKIQWKKTLDKCQHSFCRECIDSAFQVKSCCPVCMTFYGELTGSQPRNGQMTVTRQPVGLPGYEDHGTIIINYSFSDGIQGPEHPSPGVSYTGTYREAYLPDSAEGNKVLRLLQRAFQQRLVFTVGTSATTGRSNTVIWNDIHHKTSSHGGSQCFGYPDPGYLLRVQEELRVKGITEEGVSEPAGRVH